jgi:Peptidase family M28
MHAAGLVRTFGLSLLQLFSLGVDMANRLSIAGLFLLAACGGGPGAAPAPKPVPLPTFATEMEIRDAGALITPDAVLTRISVIADDSMGGRNTPSVGLEKTARYLADNYQRWGLTPMGDSGTFLQRYTLTRQRAQRDGSWLEIAQNGVARRFPLDTWASVRGPMTGLPITGPVKIIAGAMTVADITPMTLTGTIVVFVQNPARPTENQLVMRALSQKAPAAMLVLQGISAEIVRTRVANEQKDGNPTPIVSGLPLTGVLTIIAHDSLVAGMLNAPDFSAMRRQSTPMVMDLPSEITITVMARNEVVSTATAPNVVAVVTGTDSVLKNEYVVFSAHMDHVGTAGDGVGGCTAKGDDKICNGADDDGSGTTGVMSLAESVARLKGRTKRSILILNVSGEEKGLLGSAFFAAHPTVPIGNIVADINMDMIGRNNPDSIVVIGKEHSDMGETLARVQAAHPELHLIAADDIWPTESFYSRSDHFNFARKGVPVLFFFNGTHPQYHQPDDEVRLIDTSKLARVAQLAFFLGIEIANTPERPKWNPASYQTIVVDQKVPAIPKRP